MTSTDRLPRWPTPAETARTLLSGAVQATLQLPTASDTSAGSPPSYPADGRALKVRPFTAATGGELLLLVEEESGSSGARHLHDAVTGSDQNDTPALLDLLDVPPVRTDLPRARLCVTGWVEAMHVEAQRAAAVDVAATRPMSQLLTIGHGASMYRLHPAELSLARSDTTYDVDVDELRTAEPDPVYDNEHEITGHLQRYHYDDLTCWAMAQLTDVERRTLRQVTISGIDRYGLDLASVTAEGCRRSRVTFATPVPDENALGDALRELQRCPCDPQ